MPCSPPKAQATAACSLSERLVWEDGCLFTITEQETGDNELNGARNTVTFDAHKWRSALGAYFFCDCTASQDIDGRWGDYTVGSQAIS